MSASSESNPSFDAVRSTLNVRGRELGAVIEIVPASSERSGSARHVESGGLHGVAVAVKANVAVRGRAWSAGIDARSHLISTDDAPVVRALCTAAADVGRRLADDRLAAHALAVESILKAMS